MSLAVQAPVHPSAETLLGITVFGCERDEARAFDDLAPRLGVLPTITSRHVSAATARMLRGNRCVSVSHKAPVDAATLTALREAGVEYVSTRSVGFDHIDLAAAGEAGITVGNAPYAPDGVADFTVMLVLMAVRDVARLTAAAARHDFRLPERRPRELRDLTVGVVGVGSIGRAVISRLEAFGCRILACDPGRGAPGDVPLDRLLDESDIVTLHVPLLPDTRHLLGPAEFARMKPSAILVNTARGGLVDTAALLDALETGRLAGAALDVLEGEEGIFYRERRGAPLEHPHLARLLELPNVVVTPHTAFFTERALRETVRATIDNCLAFERSRA